MNILQERFLAQRSAARTDVQDGVNGRRRTKLRVTAWSDGVGAVRDREGYEYSVSVQNLTLGLDSLVAGEFVTGFIKDFETIEDIVPENQVNRSVAVRIPLGE
jgi:hypothetical protein